MTVAPKRKGTPARFLDAQEKEGTLFCVYCGVWLSREEATADHFIPRYWKRHGVTPIGRKNLVVACARCNHRKGSSHPEVFIAWLASEAGQKYVVSKRVGRTFVPVHLEMLRAKISCGALPSLPETTV